MSIYRTLARIFASLMFLFCLVATLKAQDDDFEMLEMSLDDLLDIEITTASRTKESLEESPAVTIVITQDDIQQRGYYELTSVLEDLPGFHMSRSNADTYFKTHLRGFRNTIGSPFVLLVDGQYMNSMFYNCVEVLGAIPISNVKQIEMVYGPSSSIYGANALMGVMNIITKTAADHPNGVNGFVTSVQKNAKIFGYQKTADFTYYSDESPVKFRITGRIQDGIEVNDKQDEYYFTKREHYENREIWKNLLEVNGLTGADSPVRKSAIDARGYFGDFEVGVMLYSNVHGYGNEYSALYLHSDINWAEQEENLYVKHSKEIDSQWLKNLEMSTMLRYRNSDVTRDSHDSFNYLGYVGAEFYQALNSSKSFLQTFDFDLGDQVAIVSGYSFEVKDRAKAYDWPGVWAKDFGGDLDIDALKAQWPPQDGKQFWNRNKTGERAAFALSKIDLSNWFKNGASFLNLGARIDTYEAYGTYGTLRASVVRNIGKWNLKFLVGNAVKEPAPRLVYGGWGPSQSNPEITPEKASTAEGSIGYKTKHSNLVLSTYYTKITDKLTQLDGVATNVDNGNVIGADLHAKYVRPLTTFENLQGWGYLSYINATEDQYNIVDKKPVATNQTGPVGDLATWRLRIGSTLSFNRKISTSLIARYASEIKAEDTIKTNPLSIPTFFVGDMNVIIRDFLFENSRFSFQINNILDKTNFHAGVKEANAGEQPVQDLKAFYDDYNIYSSRLAQPGRHFTVTSGIDF